jgi:Protein of unknown function (DUF4232)
MKHIRALRLTGILAIAAAGVAVMAAAWPGNRVTPTIPWLNQPVALPSAGTAAASAAHDQACTSADLAVKQVRRGIVEYGTYAYTYSATNVSTQACYISGYPAIQMAGKTIPHGFNGLGVTTGALAPGASASFAVVQTPAAACVGTSTASQRQAKTEVLRMSFGAGHAAVAAKTSSILVNDCVTTTVTPVGLAPGAPTVPDPLAALTVKLNSPASAKAGQTIRFTVTLTNPTSHEVRFSGCPSYEIGISSTRAWVRAYRLNCAQPAIRAHESASYEMQYTVPASTPAGTAKIGWFLLDPARTGAGGGITIAH